MPNMHNEVAADTARLAELIQGIRVAMFTTIGLDGQPHTRPMYTQQAEFDGDLWFFTDAQGAKVNELRNDSQVLITYDNAGQNRYVAVRGRAQVVRDPVKAKELWNLHAKGWWPGGPDDPNLALIRVEVDSAEYWEGPSHTGYFLSLLKAVATGTRVDPMGEHGTVRTTPAPM